MRSQEINKLKSRLLEASKEKDPGPRGARIAAVISDALATAQLDTVLVGGAAVAFYTNGDYTTNDIDVVAPSSDQLPEIMHMLGFERIGKDHINRDLNIYVEFPGEKLGPTEEFINLKIDGTVLKIVSIEDLIIDRLCAYKFWRSEIDGVNALRMITLGIGSRKRIEERASEEDVLDALDHVEGVLESSIRLGLSSLETNDRLRRFFKKM